MDSPPRIAIIGGGPAGLTLGVLLHQQNIPFTIFELRPEPTNEELENLSGMLDLHQESGLAALKECGLYEDFLPLTGECSQDFIVADRTGSVLYTHGGGDGLRPEISRNNLAKLLSRNIPSANIKWGHKLISATRRTTPTHVETELDFGVHGKQAFDLVIGADGAWSKVRGLLTNVQPQFTNMYIITLTIKNITSKYPHLAKLVGTGSFSSLGKKHGVMSQRGPIDSSRLYLWLTIPDEDFGASSGVAGKPATVAKQKLFSDDALLGTFTGLSKELVETACDEEARSGENLDIRALYALPHGTSWEHAPGVTLLGDAAHVMLPNGEGVNAAMFDALMLFKAIQKSYETSGKDVDLFYQTFDPLLQDYETGLVERAKKLGKETDELIGQMFGSEDTAQDFAQFFRNIAEEGPEE
ncbi:unnamed protein product [Clonostachys rosea f. rosea IK726]|uniref:Uncharacterized protein n=1 Tax=Clonostachys rosea f. rosea IK726 TaxID=1349383 RepID=A0ACA9U2V6_BIOOC|nr:unnamed protein product [Clonostachys rosea f. rosea IK726]